LSPRGRVDCAGISDLGCGPPGRPHRTCLPDSSAEAGRRGVSLGGCGLWGCQQPAHKLSVAPQTQQIHRAGQLGLKKPGPSCRVRSRRVNSPRRYHRLGRHRRHRHRHRQRRQAARTRTRSARRSPISQHIASSECTTFHSLTHHPSTPAPVNAGTSTFRVASTAPGTDKR
jgi:hypothetical protein